MSRNRKSQSAAIRFGPALKAFVLCALIGGSGVGYVWQKDQISQLGQQIKSREIHLILLEEQNDKLHRQLSSMCSPSALELRIQELKLGLVPPQPSQILRLTSPAFEMQKAATETQYAAKEPVLPEIP